MRTAFIHSLLYHNGSCIEVDFYATRKTLKIQIFLFKEIASLPLFKKMASLPSLILRCNRLNFRLLKKMPMPLKALKFD
jgi:hypothetical protein